LISPLLLEMGLHVSFSLAAALVVVCGSLPAHLQRNVLGQQVGLLFEFSLGVSFSLSLWSGDNWQR
jgi:hypothetical protein